MKSLTIDCQGARGSTYDGALYSLRVKNLTASDIVTIRGVDIDGANYPCPGVDAAIHFESSAGTLQIQKSKLNHMGGACSGVVFAPTGPARLNISDSTVNDSGATINTAGILIRPESGGSANVSIDGTEIKHNINGIFVDGSGGGGAVNVDVRDSVITTSTNGGPCHNHALRSWHVRGDTYVYISADCWWMRDILLWSYQQ